MQADDGQPEQESTGLLPFHRRMVQELTEADGICVMAAGGPGLLAACSATLTSRQPFPAC